MPSLTFAIRPTAFVDDGDAAYEALVANIAALEADKRAARQVSPGPGDEEEDGD